MKTLKSLTRQSQKNDLVSACTQGNVKKVKRLLKNAKTNINQVNEHGETGLIKAAYNGNKKVCELLLTREKIAIDKTDNRGNTALFWAVVQEKYEIAQLLLEHQAQPDHTHHEEKLTALKYASNHNNLPLIQLLIQYGADQKQLERKKRDSIRILYPEVALSDSPEKSNGETPLKKVTSLELLMRNIHDAEIVCCYLRYKQLHERVSRLK